MVIMVGRDDQLGEIASLLDEATGRHGAALVISGEAGIGKSALLERAIRDARDHGMRVLSVAGVQAEGTIPYAGLDNLLRPLRPAPTTSGSPYRRAVEVLELLGDLDEPVLLAIEDAHWMDAASWETLTFLCRRVESDRIAVLMTVRDGEDIDRRLAAAGLPELPLAPLSRPDADALLQLTAPDLQPVLRARVLDESAGNPLGIVELGAAAARSGASALLPFSMPLSTRVERTFGGLVAELPPRTRTLLLIAALSDGGSLAEIRAAAAVMTGAEVPIEAIDPAVANRLVTLVEPFELRFRHPLLRSALRRQAQPGDRHRAHAALSEVLSDSPDRSLWHRASAAAEPDEALAAELSEAAAQAVRRESVPVALEMISRAVQLSQDPAERGHRQIWAALLGHGQGDGHLVRRLIAEVDNHALRPADQARLAWLTEAYRPVAWSGPERMLTYADLIDTMRRDGDPGLALQAMAEIQLRVYYSNVPPPIRDRLVEVALGLGRPEDHPRLTSILLLIAPVEHGAAGLDNLERLVHRVDLPPGWRTELAIGAWAIGAFPIAGTLALSSVADLREQGRLGTLSEALNVAAAAYAGIGDTRAALPLAAECIALAEEVGQPNWALGGGLIAALAEALSGDVASARRRADVAEQAFSAGRRHPMLALVQRARGVAALAEGRPDEAFRQLARVYDPADTTHHPHQRMLLMGHLAEAATLGGLQDELRPLVSEMEPIAAQSRSPALRVGLGYAHAVLTGDYLTALAEDLTDWPFDRARLQLTYGTALRRSRRSAESRTLLREAAATFDALGATPWADRAGLELRATGETRRRAVDLTAELTPQEQQIARLAAEGLSNREIGERLFLSPRTVSTHLYRIYPKVNVRSRAELARAVSARANG